MQYWFERLGELNPLVESLPLELIALIVVCLALAVVLSKYVFKLLIGLARIGVIAALVLLALSYASSITLPAPMQSKKSSQIIVLTKMQIGQSLVDLGERIKPID